MPKKTRVWVIFAAVVVVLAAALLIYTRPMTVEKLLGKKISTESCVSIQTWVTVFPTANSREQQYAERTITPEDAEFETLVRELQTHTFRRSLWTLLSANGIRTHSIAAGDVQWRVFCDLGGGCKVSIDNFFGEISMNTEMSGYSKITASDEDVWLREILDLIYNGDGAVNSDE